MDTASALSKGIAGPARWSLRVLGGFELGVLPGGERVALPGKRELSAKDNPPFRPSATFPRKGGKESD